tara:strand:- start:1966 stop:2121 length:156 start_codon:yes stop_codon:yes gene_type:complete
MADLEDTLEKEVNFDFQEFSLEDLSMLNTGEGWVSGSLSEKIYHIDPTWLE